VPLETRWPGDKRFAFTIFDDTDLATLENVSPVYSFLRDCGFRTTKSAWVIAGDPGQRESGWAGATCEEPDHLRWLLDLQASGFEIGWHNATWNGVPRAQILRALERFAELFGHEPTTASNHSLDEGIYWGEARVTGWHAFAYGLLTCFRNYSRFRGHVENDEFFWGDFCKAKIKYYRNFVFQDINTLKMCPFMPYHDPRRPYVNQWFASSNGQNVRSFDQCISEESQDRLEEEGGACIIYTHFAKGFAHGQELEPRFESLMKRLARKNGWFVPAATLLDYLLAANGSHAITDVQRRRLERKWLLEKIWTGTN
jgi:hypothetical protein